MDTKNLTEWEKEKEKEEFQNKYQQKLKQNNAISFNSIFVIKLGSIIFIILLLCQILFSSELAASFYLPHHPGAKY